MGYYYCRKWLTLILSMWVLIRCSESTRYVVGDGENWSWKFPLPSRDILSLWASSHNFLIGDVIAFCYDSRNESVHAVNEGDYSSCNVGGKGHLVDHDGNTKVILNKIGMYYFISGNKRHCKGGLKLALLVTQPPIPPPPPSVAFPLPTPKSLVAFPPPPPSPLAPSLSAPALAPSPSPNSSGGGGGGESMICLGVSMAMMMMFRV
ncbi:early nodulin-16 [Cicer arietinum]|uniref:Early nodulin-16 n=1 Tax=Cicer arietinum TaxID=3827 RepID=A0A1S2YQ97_CICAR|nr:early nodulin-16 [Cicer arietinum]